MRYMRQISPKMYHRPLLDDFRAASGMALSSLDAIFFIGGGDVAIGPRHCAGLGPRCKPNYRRTACCDKVTILSSEALGEHLRHVNRGPPGAVLDLVTAGGAVGDDDRVGGCVAHRRQERQLSHGERDVDRLGMIAEAA